MVTRYFAAASFFLIILLYGCTSYNFDKKFSHLPEKPQAGENLTILYNPENSPLKNSDEIVAYLYFFSHKLDTVVAIDMTRKSGGWICEYEVSPAAVTLLVKFMDGEGKKEDNNKEHSYIVNMFDETGNLLPENKAVMGVITAVRGTYAGLKTNREKGITLLEEAFGENPQLLKKFAGEYFYNLNRAKGTDTNELITQKLADLEGMNDDSEDMLITLTKWYEHVGDSIKSDEYKIKLNDTFPSNSFAEDELYAEIRNEKEIEKQLQLLDEFANRFPNSSSIPMAYYNVANSFLRAEDYSGLENFLLTNSDNTHLYSFYKSVSTMLDTNVDLGSALKISSAGIKRSEKDIVNPASKKPVSYSDREWIKQNKTYASLNFLVHSKVLKEMDNIEEALIHSKRALDLSGGEESEVNELYAELLLESENYSEVITACREFILAGSATSKIKEVLKGAYAAERGSEDGFEEYLVAIEKEAFAELYKKLQDEMINEPPIDFSLNDLDGKTVSLTDLKGKVVILDFWATWCNPCLSSFPGMKTAVEKFEDDESVKFVFVNSWERVANKKENAANFLRDTNYPFHVLMDEENKVITDYGVSGIPTKFIIDGSGSIRFKSVGFDGNADHLVDEISAMIQLAKEGS